MGRTIPSWRLVVNDELGRIARFRDFLRPEDEEIFDDLLRQCKHYAPYASTMASVVKEVPLMFSMLFGQHKMIWELEKRLAKLEATLVQSSNEQESTPILKPAIPSELEPNRIANRLRVGEGLGVSFLMCPSLEGLVGLPFGQ